MPTAASKLVAVGGTAQLKDVAANVVFVHGLGGDHRTTWQPSNDAKAFWPKWLYDDLNPSGKQSTRPVGVWSIDYPAAVFEVLFLSKASKDSIPQRAQNILDTLVERGLADRPVVFVSHSLGGIMVKQMLRISAGAGAKSPFAKLVLSTRLVMFIATPHAGSSIARLAKWVETAAALGGGAAASAVHSIPGAALIRGVVGKVVRRGDMTKSLEDGDPWLDDIGSWYRNNAPESGIVTRAYYEYAKKGISVVVTKESANPGISGVDVVGIDADHGSICKPTARNDHYERLTGPIKTAIEQCPVFKETHLAELRLGKRFERLSQLTAAERQKVTKDVIHKVEESLGREFGDASAATDSGEGGLPEFQPAAWQRSLAATSPYDLDRIILNVWHQYRGGLSKSDPARAVRLEAQRLGVALEEGGGMTLVPLYYAARALAVQKDSGGAKLGITAKTDVEDASELVAKLVKTRDMDGNSKTTNILKRILA